MEHFNKNTLRNNAGFTLVEVLIAITILTFISLSTFVMVDSNLSTREEVTKEDGLILQAVTATNRIDSDFSQFYTPLFYSVKNAPTKSDPNAAYQEDNVLYTNDSFDGTTKDGGIIPQIINADKSTLIFFTQANRRKFANSKESRFTWVKYKLKAMTPDPENPDDKSSGRYELVRQTIATDIYNSEKNWDEPKEQLLLTHIKELEFSFWDPQAQKFTTNLQDLNEFKFAPRMLKVKITWIDADENEQKIEKISRVLNPYFDTTQDNIDNNSKKTNNTGLPDQNSGGPGGNSSESEEEEEF